MGFEYAVWQSRSFSFYKLLIDWIVEKETLNLLLYLSGKRFIGLILTVVFKNNFLGESFSSLFLVNLGIIYTRKIVVFTASYALIRPFALLTVVSLNNLQI